MEENEQLNLQLIDSIIKVFQYRRNSSNFTKYPSDTFREISLIAQIPVIERNNLSNFKNNLKRSSEISLAMKNLNFSYEFNNQVLSELCDIAQSGKNIPEAIASILFFQALVRVYPKNEINEVDFLQIIRTVNIFHQNKIKAYLNMVFYIIILAAYNSKLNWTNDCVKHVRDFLLTNKDLNKYYYEIFVRFLKITIQVDSPNHQRTIDALKMTQYMFSKINEYPILNVQNFQKIIDEIAPFIINFQREAISILGYVSNRDKSDYIINLISSLPSAFVVILKKNNCSNTLKLSESKIIHTIPHVFDKPVQNFDFHNTICDTFNENFLPLDPALAEKSKSLYKLIPSNSKSYWDTVKTLRIFLKMLNPSHYPLFFKEMNNTLFDCVDDKDYDIFIAYIYILDTLQNPKLNAIIAENIPYFFMQNKSDSQSKYFGDLFFNPKMTLYGPESLDPIINKFRSTILILIKKYNKDIYFDLVNTIANYPFLVAELLGRTFYKFPIDFLVKDSFFKIVGSAAAKLQILNAPIDPRNAIFIFIFQFLRNESTLSTCLSSSIFVDQFFRYIFESGIHNQILHIIHNSFLLIPDPKLTSLNSTSISQLSSSKTFEASVSFLYKSAEVSPNLAPLIYKMVKNIIYLKPFLINKFEIFGDLVMKYLDKKKDNESFEIAMSIISNIMNCDDSFELNSTYFRIFAETIPFANYTLLLNLIFGTNCFSSNAFSFIKQPRFIPFFVIAYSDQQKINEIMKFFLNLANISETNAKIMHDGDLDLILLSFIQNGDHIQYKGFNFILKIDPSIIQPVIIPLLNLIISAKSSCCIAKMLCEIITKNHNTLISNLVNTIILRSDNTNSDFLFNGTYNIFSNNNVPAPSFPIGTLKPFCVIDDLNNTFFNGDLTVTFWLKIDPILLSRSTAIVKLISISDIDYNSFNIILQNNLLYASYDNPQYRTVVTLCQRMNPNMWVHFGILFHNSKDEKPLLSTYKDYERLHDSEFCNVDLSPGIVKVEFGGHDFEHREITYPNEEYGRISGIHIFNRMLDSNEIIELYENGLNTPKDYIIRTNDYLFTKLNKKSRFAYNGRRHMHYMMNNYVNETLLQCLSNTVILDKLIDSILTAPRTIIDQIFSIICHIIPYCTRFQISARLSSILMNIDVDYKLYKSLCSVVANIQNENEKLCWFEDILINCSLWERCDSYYKILFDYTNSSVFYSFFKRKVYFNYFLCHFDYILKQLDQSSNNAEPKRKYIDKEVQYFLIFLERLANISFNSNNAETLISFLGTSSDSNKLIYLDLISKIAKTINFVKFNNIESVYTFLGTNDINIVKFTIIALHQIFGRDFHQKVFIILGYITVPLNQLFDILVPLVKTYFNLFSLICAISLQTGQDPSDFIPDKLSLSKIWFFFPLLSSLLIPNNDKLIDFIARKAVICPLIEKSSCIHTIICYATYMDEFAEKNTDKFLYKILDKLLKYSNEKEMNNHEENNFSIFFHTISAAFYKLNAPLYHEEIINLLDIKPDQSPVHKRVKITNYKTLTDFITLVINFHEENIKPREECSKILNEKKNIDNNILDFDEEFHHAQAILESVKTFDFHFYYDKDQDKDLLKRAYQMSEEIHDYKMKNIETTKSGTLIKTTTPIFGLDDITKVMESFINIENDQFFISSRRYSTGSDITMKEQEKHDFYEKMNRIFDYLATELEKIISPENLKQLINGTLNTKSQSVHISSELYNDLIKSEEERTANLGQIEEKVIHFRRSSNRCYSLHPFLMKRVKSIQKIKRFQEKHNELSHPNSNLISFNEKIPAVFSYSNNTAQTNNKNIKASSPDEAFSYLLVTVDGKVIINEHNLINIFNVNDTSLEIVGPFNKPYLIDFDQSKSKDAFSTQIPTDQNLWLLKETLEKKLAFYQLEWSQGKLSSFSYISILNILSGRTYENPERYPVFPSLDISVDPNDIDTSLPSLERTWFGTDKIYGSENISPEIQYKNRLYVLPELYYLYETDKIEEIYQRRQNLEKATNLHEWIGKAFGMEFGSKSHPPRETMTISTTLQQLDLSQNPSMLIYSAPLYLQNSFVVIDSNGIIKFIRIKFNEENIPSFERLRSDYKLENITSYKFYPFNTGVTPYSYKRTARYQIGLIAYNMKKIVIITQSQVIEKNNIYLEKPIFHESIFLATPSKLSRVSYLLYNQIDNLIGQTFCDIPSNVTTIQSSITFGIIVIGSTDCKIRIKSLETGKKICTYDLGQYVPTNILITESWGFVVVNAGSKLFVFSTNGNLIKSIDDFPSFKQWYTYKTKDDFDYIVFEDHDHSIMHFEVMYPENIHKLFDFNAKILSIRYDMLRNCFLVITDNERLMILPPDINSEK